MRFYARPPTDSPLKQGDLFKLIPRIELSLASAVVTREDEIQEGRWVDVAESGKEYVVSVGVRPVFAIIVSQDCDVLRESDLALAGIDTLPVVSGLTTPESSKLASWTRLITRDARMYQKWFYLPADPDIGFSEPMAVDFKSLTRLSAPDLHTLRSNLRVAALPSVALEHFQHKVADYFTRYAYDEWYPLTKGQFDMYRANFKDEVIEPLPWQSQ